IHALILACTQASYRSAATIAARAEVFRQAAAPGRNRARGCQHAGVRAGARHRKSCGPAPPTGRHRRLSFFSAGGRSGWQISELTGLHRAGLAQRREVQRGEAELAEYLGVVLAKARSAAGNGQRRGTEDGVRTRVREALAELRVLDVDEEAPIVPVRIMD